MLKAFFSSFKDPIVFCFLIAILIVLIYKPNGGTTINHISKSDTVRSMLPGVIKQVVNNNPVPYAVDHYNEKIIVERMDTAMLRKLVYDYFSTRMYKDSLKLGDTATFYFDATVEKNAMVKHTMKGKVNIPLITVTNTQNIYRNSLFIGAGPGYNNTRLTGAIYGGFETKQMQFGVSLDPFYKTSYIFISKRINFKK